MSSYDIWSYLILQPYSTNDEIIWNSSLPQCITLNLNFGSQNILTRVSTINYKRQWNSPLIYELKAFTWQVPSRKPSLWKVCICFCRWLPGTQKVTKNHFCVTSKLATQNLCFKGCVTIKNLIETYYNYTKYYWSCPQHI